MSSEAIAFFRERIGHVPRPCRGLLLAIASYVGPRGQPCTASLRTLADQAGIAFSTARERADELERAGIIARERTVANDGGRGGIGYAVTLVGFGVLVPLAGTRTDGRAALAIPPC